MALLLDTHALLWSAFAPERLSPGTRVRLADSSEPAFFSVVSLWEIAIKHRIGKLRLTPSLVAAAGTAAGFTLLHLDPRHIDRVPGLPRVEGHNDPFDHLLVAQAIEEGLTLVTADGRLPAYGVAILAA